MAIEDIEIDDGDEYVLNPEPQHTIKFFSRINDDGHGTTIIVGYNDSDAVGKREGHDSEIYTFPSGLTFTLPSIEYWENHNYNNTGDVPGFDVTMNPSLHIYDHIKMGALKKLKKTLDNIVRKQVGKELSEVQRLGMNKGLPENVDSRIGSFLTGKNGSTKAQMNKLKQNSGIQGPPRAGGSRKTRKRSKHLK